MFLFSVAKKDEDGNSKPVEILKRVNRFIFRRGTKIACCSEWSLVGVYSATQFKYIIPIIARVFYGGAIIVAGISISSCLISYFVYKKDIEIDEDEIIETEQEKLANFINNDYDLFIDIYKNKTEDYFTNKSNKFIIGLKDVSNHEIYDLPHSYNDQLIFFYDNDSDRFHYYCKSDVSYKILNSVCRSYTIANKCIQLFQDEEEINYMQGEAINDADISFTTVSTDTDKEDDDESEDESSGYINIFYNKNSKKNKKKNKVVPQLKTNKFIYKGTLDEYEKIFINNKTKAKAKETSYEDYVAKCLK